MNIQIREETQHDPYTFTAKISFDGRNERTINIRDPFADETAREERLEWYYESWVSRPYLDTVDAERAAASVREYGESLFLQLFEHWKARSNYASAGDDLSFEIVGTPTFHALHWEALRDPDKPLPLAVEHPFVRRNVTEVPTEIAVKPSTTLNILLVTARPSGRRDVAYRTISQPLFDALDDARLRTQLDIVRPGTWEALVRHLEQTRTRHGKGHYHIVHFDLHGGLLTYEQYLAYKERYEASNYQYDTPTSFDFAQTDLKPYDGLQAFLLFDGQEEGVANCVTAEDVAMLLQTYHVPIAILNACQSAKEVGARTSRPQAEEKAAGEDDRAPKAAGEDDRAPKMAGGDDRAPIETSLGSRLVKAGVQWVVAMGYSVTVVAAQKLMTTLYQRLLAGDGLPSALRQGRLELLRDKKRHQVAGVQVELEDWLLPVVYQNGAVALDLQEMTAAQLTAFYARTAYQDSDRFHDPAYGFHGRDLDLLELERRLVNDNVLLVRGMGGAGKTTLLHHVAMWWQRTSWVGRVFYFGYDERAHTHQQILTAIGKRLWGEVGYINALQPLALGVQEKEIVRRLRGERHLLILDNLESVTGTALAIQHTLAADEREKLRRFVDQLRGGASLVLLGSRSGTEWLIGEAGAVYALPGLDAGGEATLVAAILRRHQVQHYLKDDTEQKPLRQLLKLLGGYPLALEVVLPNLRHSTPSAELAKLEAGDVNLDTAADAATRTNSLLQCIEASHGNLSEDAQALLLCLAPFVGVFNFDWIEQYTTQLREQDALVDLPFERWGEVLQEAVNWGLLKPVRYAEAQQFLYLELQPIFPYFLKTRLMNDTRQAAIEEGFQLHYNNIGDALKQIIQSKQPKERQFGHILIKAEFENLRSSVQLALDRKSPFIGALEALFTYLRFQQMYQQAADLFIDIFNTINLWLKSTNSREIDISFYLVSEWYGTILLRLREYQYAEQVFQQAISIAHQLDKLNFKQNALHQLGRVKEEQHELKEAADYYRQALTIQIKLDDRHSQVKTLHHLGTINQKEREWGLAKEYYQQVLDILVENNDRHGQATALHQLGMVEEEQREWEAAEYHFQQALEINIEYDDRYRQAKALHHLGRIKQQQRKWKLAQNFYQQALDIFIEYNDHDGLARTLSEFGTVKQEQREWKAAERYFQQALEIKIAINDRYGQASTLHHLGIVKQAQREWELTERYFQQALEIKIAINDRYRQASTLHHLGMVKQEQREWKAAERYFQQAIDICIEFNARYNQATSLHQLGRVKEEKREWEAAERYYQQALEIKIAFNDRYSQASTYNQLGSIAELQEKWKTASHYYLQAIEIAVEYSDQYRLGTRTQSLARVWQASDNPAIPDQLAALLGGSSAEAVALLQKAL